MMRYGEELGMTFDSNPAARRSRILSASSTRQEKRTRRLKRTPAPMEMPPRSMGEGFSAESYTWLPVPPSYAAVNVASESRDHWVTPYLV